MSLSNWCSPSWNKFQWYIAYQMLCTVRIFIDKCILIIFTFRFTHNLFKRRICHKFVPDKIQMGHNCTALAQCLSANQFLHAAEVTTRCLLLKQTDAYKICWLICCLATVPSYSVVCIMLVISNQCSNYLTFLVYTTDSWWTCHSCPTYVDNDVPYLVGINYVYSTCLIKNTAARWCI